MSPSMQLGIAATVFAAIVVALVLYVRRSDKGFVSALEQHGFKERTSCPWTVTVGGSPLHVMKCYEGRLASKVTGDVIRGYVHGLTAKGTYTWYLGVVVPASVGVDDAWRARFPRQDVVRTPDGDTVVLWQTMDTARSAALIFEALADTFHS